jgi:outer membrane lipoprotein-sorting protein
MNRRVKRLRAVVVVALLAALVPLAHAEETARQILDRRKALDEGAQHWNDRQQHMSLRIVDKRGGERMRELEVYERRYPNDETKSIVFFLAPAEVKGTGFLAFNHKGRAADQWLYLPALKRVRQITARARSESFMGTDLSYRDLDLLQDMTRWTEEDARSSLRGSETVDDADSWVIEETPVRDDIGYQKIVLWLSKDDLFPRRIDLFEDGAEPKKRIDQREVKVVDGIPTAHRTEVQSPEAGSRTEIDISDVRFNKGLDDSVFSERYLQRGKL